MTILRIAGKLVPSAVSVGTTATAIPTTAATGRISILVTNNGTNTVYLGDSTVTTINGTPLEVGEKLPMDLDKNVVLYGITSTGTSDVRVLEGV